MSCLIVSNPSLSFEVNILMYPIGLLLSTSIGTSGTMCPVGYYLHNKAELNSIALKWRQIHYMEVFSYKGNISVVVKWHSHIKVE